LFLKTPKPLISMRWFSFRAVIIAWMKALTIAAVSLFVNPVSDATSATRPAFVFVILPLLLDERSNRTVYQSPSLWGSFIHGPSEAQEGLHPLQLDTLHVLHPELPTELVEMVVDPEETEQQDISR
jgi:hypothetical protein